MKQIYDKLLDKYGQQGWWPINNKYHKGYYSYPQNDDEVFEVCLGSILTQNTSWKGVEKALENLRRINSLSVKGLNKLSEGKLREMIRPAGYYNQKAKYIRNFVEFFESLEGRVPTREELLDVKGIGEETADSMMLYAYKQPYFVVDAYTKRIFLRLGLIDKKATYHDVQKKFMDELDEDRELFNEYHALIVEHAKQHCMMKPKCEGCCLKGVCKRK